MRIFRKKKANEVECDVDDVGQFSIEYYTFTERYYPKHKDKYLKDHIFSYNGYISEVSNRNFAEWFKTEESARCFISRYKIYLKENEKIIININ